MPNYCNYEMKVTGIKENVEEFINIIQADYYIDENGHSDCDRHFWRVFEAEVYNTGFQDDKYFAELYGYCAWSVYSCMCDGEYTYNGDHPNMGGTTLEIESKRLNLTIELFSDEPGCEFAEHFLFINGDWVINDCVDFQEYDTIEFENVEEMNAEYDTDFTQEEFEANDTIYVGGFPNWRFDAWKN